jgi:hypothetical protein
VFPISQEIDHHEPHSKLAGFLLGLFFFPEDEGDIYLRNVG